MALHLSTATAVEERAPHAPFLALGRLLDDLVNLLMAMPPEVYAARPFPGVSGSIGEHVRHTLDHIGALVAGDPSATLSYDHRERGTAVESDPSAALRHILRLKAALERWSTRSLDEPVKVASMVSSSGETVTGWSTLVRELAFVMSHTIHHQAIIALLLGLQGLGVPDRFGYAPSTPADRS